MEKGIYLRSMFVTLCELKKGIGVVNNSDRDIKSYKDQTSRGFLDYVIGRVDSEQAITDYEGYMKDSSD